MPLLRSALILLALALPAAAQAPEFSSDGRLVRPAGYREWVFVTSGLGMTYGPAEKAAERPPRFDNVFVTRESYQEFLRSGTWPDRTMFVLEIRRAEENVSINNGGRTQSELLALEASVKDSKRFAGTGGWAYFSFDAPGGGLVDAAAPLPADERCYACHSDNSASDNTFVQFYPTLFEAAKRHGTIKPDYDPALKP